MMRAPWILDEFRQVGIDFESPEEVAGYDERQGENPAEDDALLDRLGARAGHVLVDLGAGTGSLSLRAARRGLTVHAVDVSPVMLDRTRAKAERDGLQGIHLHHAGFLTYQQADPGADFVVTRFALHHLPDFWKGVALLRIAAMLRPGGHALIRDVVYSFLLADYEQSVETWISEFAREDGQGWPRAAYETHLRDEYSTFGWIMEGLIERAGLQIVTAQYTNGAYADYYCQKPE